jgi:hypothetical protein
MPHLRAAVESVASYGKPVTDGLKVATEDQASDGKGRLELALQLPPKQGRRKRKLRKLLFLLVGARGFEPPTSCSQSRRATGLRYAPTPVVDDDVWPEDSWHW